MQSPANTTNNSPRGWHSRGYLPHFDGGSETTQVVTYRLADSLPVELLEQWQRELETLPDDKRNRQMRERIDEYLDRGLGECHLANPAIAEVVENAFLHFDNQRYLLHAWVVMPNHIHVLFTPAESFALSQIVQSWKSFTAKEANRILERTGRFWQQDYFDRYVRDDRHFAAAWAYIEANPVKAGLCRVAEEWRWSSAWRRVAKSQVIEG